MAESTIYVSNWASHRTPGHHGPGRKFRIMAQPRRWEHGAGHVTNLSPDDHALRRVKSDPERWADWYQEACREKFAGRLAHGTLAPRKLLAFAGGGAIVVADGDTLCCACSREVAAEGGCHRVWAAEYLARAGWRVVLDGELLEVSDG